MALDSVAQRYAHTLYVDALEELTRKHAAHKSEVIAALARRNILPHTAGHYHSEMTRLGLEFIGDLANAMLDSQLAAYERAKAPVDDQAVTDIHRKVVEFCESQGKSLSFNVQQQVRQAGMPDGVSSQMAATIAAGITGVEARVYRKLSATRDEEIMAARAESSKGSLSAEVSPTSTKKTRPPADNEANAAAHGSVAFISYSWDSQAHKKWVLDLACRLRGKDGVPITLDQWHLQLGGDKTVFMEKSVTNSKFVILICTQAYARKANSREGGVGYEATIITGELAERINEGKFIPVLRDGNWKSSLPVWIKTKIGVDLSKDPYSEEEYQILLRTLHGKPLAPPPLGPKPMFGNSESAVQEVEPPEWAVRAMQLDEDLTPYDREATRRKLAVVRIDAWHPRLTVWLTNRSDHSIRVRSVSLWHSNDGRNHKRLSHGVPSDNRIFVELRPHTEDVPIAFVTDEDAKLKLQSLGVVEKHLAGYEFSDDVDVEVRVEYDLLGVEDEYRETVRVRVHGDRQIKSL